MIIFFIFLAVYYDYADAACTNLVYVKATQLDTCIIDTSTGTIVYTMYSCSSEDVVTINYYSDKTCTTLSSTAIQQSGCQKSGKYTCSPSSTSSLDAKSKKVDVIVGSVFGVLLGVGLFGFGFYKFYLDRVLNKNRSNPAESYYDSGTNPADSSSITSNPMRVLNKNRLNPLIPLNPADSSINPADSTTRLSMNPADSNFITNNPIDHRV